MVGMNFCKYSFSGYKHDGAIGSLIGNNIFIGNIVNMLLDGLLEERLAFFYFTREIGI